MMQGSGSGRVSRAPRDVSLSGLVLPGGKRLWLLGGILAGAIGLLVWTSRRRKGAAFTLPSFIKNVKVTSGIADSEGWVQATPKDLARQAGGVSVETYTLARFLGSEYASGSPLARASIAWAILNTLKKRQTVGTGAGRDRAWTLLRMATFTAKHGDRGLYGSQEHGRFASTARDPTDADLYIANMVLTGAWKDPTGGADQFLDPKTQRILHERKPDIYKSVEDVLANWLGTKGTREPFVVPGTDGDKLLFVRNKVIA